jgi:hypothetical protein
MRLADEVTDFVREYFAQSDIALAAETDIVAVFGSQAPDTFSDFLEEVSRHFGITHRELRDMAPGADSRPPGIVHFAWDLFFRKIDMEVVCVDRLTIAELTEIAYARVWPERFLKPGSQV